MRVLVFRYTGRLLLGVFQNAPVNEVSCRQWGFGRSSNVYTLKSDSWEEAINTDEKTLK